MIKSFSSIQGYRHHVAFFLIGLATFGISSRLQALSLNVGMAAVEGGDDRRQPAVSLGVSRENIVGRLYFYGRNFAGVSERGSLFSLGSRFSFLGSKVLSGILGIAALREVTEIKGAEPSKEAQHNLGALMGFGLTLRPGQRFQLSLNWDAHVFLAGAAGLFLATGRKEVIHLDLGFDL